MALFAGDDLAAGNGAADRAFGDTEHSRRFACCQRPPGSLVLSAVRWPLMPSMPHNVTSIDEREPGDKARLPHSSVCRSTIRGGVPHASGGVCLGAAAGLP